jgi:NADH dehydrogenase
VASLGLHKGVADVYGFKVKGLAAWFLHRAYHLSRIPTFNRKVRILLDWTLALLFRRDLVPLGRLQQPYAEFRAAAQQGPRTGDGTVHSLHGGRRTGHQQTSSPRG